jgi:hypothetical protein
MLVMFVIKKWWMFPPYVLFSKRQSILKRFFKHEKNEVLGMKILFKEKYYVKVQLDL